MDVTSYYKAAQVNSHYDFQKMLEKMLVQKDLRFAFYDRLLADGADLSKDLFLDYFELYGAERKTNKQDFTPQSVAALLVGVTTHNPTDAPPIEVYDNSAGTGALILETIAQLQTIRKGGALSDYQITAWELTAQTIPFLVHNLAIRNLQGSVYQGDALHQRAIKIIKLRAGRSYAEIEVHQDAVSS